MKVKELRNIIVDNDIEKESFLDIVNMDEEENITKEKLREMLDESDSYELAFDHIDDYEENLLKWYLSDLERLYQYADKSDSFSTHKVIEILKEGQKIYWEKEIDKIHERLSDFLNNWK